MTNLSEAERLLECVPNFSEGRNRKVIDAIADAIRGVSGVKLLHVDTGAAANRTVMTFAGLPEAVCEAAFRAVKTAAEHIDMSRHRGEHPRIGATDVLPLVPVKGVSLEEAAAYARHLSQRVYDELKIPVYCYEAAAFFPERKNLAVCRSGEYEGLQEKLSRPEWRPDFGPGKYTEQVKKSGLTVIGARPFLIAVNFNLDTDSVKTAQEIAGEIRESGRLQVSNGERYRIPGLLKGVKAIGWYIEEYGIAQVSVNITDMEQTPLHIVYDTIRAKAEEKGRRITGTEIIGLVPERVLTDAGRYFSDDETPNDKDVWIETAIRNMGLNDLKPFDPAEKILERCMNACSGLSDR